MCNKNNKKILILIKKKMLTSFIFSADRAIFFSLVGKKNCRLEKEHMHLKYLRFTLKCFFLLSLFSFRCKNLIRLTDGEITSYQLFKMHSPFMFCKKLAMKL